VRARFEAATALCAIVSTLSELERIQPELGAEHSPELPRAIDSGGDMVSNEAIERGLWKDVTATPPRIT
jgi:hypothetical protein